MNKYKVTFSYIDAWLISWTEDEIYDGDNMKEVFDNAWHDGKNGEYKNEFLDIVKIELINEEDE